MLWNCRLNGALDRFILIWNHLPPTDVVPGLEPRTQGNSLFERENAKVAANIAPLYEGLKPAIMKRYGETDDREEEVI